jgi:hypothetical protein
VFFFRGRGKRGFIGLCTVTGLSMWGVENMANGNPEGVSSIEPKNVKLAVGGKSATHGSATQPLSVPIPVFSAENVPSINP